MTSGTVEARRAPNKIAEIGTPAGSSHSGAMTGHWLAGVVNREFGCAAGSAEPGVQSRPVQSVRCAGGWSVRPSHHTSPSSVSATLVKMLLAVKVATALADRKSTRLNSSHSQISYAVFCLKKKKTESLAISM